MPGHGAADLECRLNQGQSDDETELWGPPLPSGVRSGAEGYPPYNIEAVTENAYRITLAVAGFREDDLSITVEDRQLVIRGRQADDTGDRVFLHRGIAARAFQRSFVLADGVEVAGASMEHGLLNIDLRRQVPETVVQTIRIGKGAGK